MYAVIQTGGKQYRVAPGDTLRIEKLPIEEGSLWVCDQVLLIADGAQLQVGTPVLAQARVEGEVKRQGRGDKIRIIKFRRRKHHLKHQGHRQYFTEVEIKAIHPAV